MTQGINRRTFVKAGAAGVAAALASPRAYGANERIRVGLIGAGNRGGQLIGFCEGLSQMEFAAICDVYQPFREEWAEKLGGIPHYNDFRELLDRNDIDAVILATPDHWHAIQTIAACEAGKDVFVEKPLCMTVKEGRRMANAARRHDRIVTMGVQRRSAAVYQRLRALLAEGHVGKVTVSRSYRISNMWPNGIGKAPNEAPPSGLDWDLWLGPRPARPFNPMIAPYKFRWWEQYSSQLGNWGVHYFDLIRWLINEEAPASVSSHGGVYAVDDMRTIPDTLHTTFEFASGGLMLFGQYEASGHGMFPRRAEFELRGTKAAVYAHARGFEVVPERGGQFQEREPYAPAVEFELDEGDPTVAHLQNFLDCIKSRQRPNCDVEEGHKSTIFSHLGNIALATRTRLDWDPVAERITNHEPANEHLDYEYRAPWKSYQA